MNEDAHLAFEHPEERAKVTAIQPCDRISLRDHIVEAEIGAFQVERDVTQRMSFNVVVEVRPSSGADTDNVDDILSYDRITEAIAAEVDVERLNLLETLAERIADRILQEPQALRVFVRIEKLDRGPGKLGVEVVRSASDVANRTEDNLIKPVIVHLTKEALRSSCISGWINQLSDSPKPVVVSVDLDEPIRNVDESVKKQVSLLAIEQNAWRLFGTETKCKVVASKTELDWGMKHNQISVWAPSKLVLDGVDVPSFNFDQPAALVGWFAEQIGADEVILVGDAEVDTLVRLTNCSTDSEQLPL